MMIREQFKEKVDEMFKDFKVLRINKEEPNHYLINEKNNYTIEFFSTRFFIVQINKDYSYAIHASDRYDDYETYLDEIIIFKELSMQKYLN